MVSCFFHGCYRCWRKGAKAQDARRIVEPLAPAIIDNARIVAVEMEAASLVEPAIAKFDAEAAKTRRKSKAIISEGERPAPAQYALLPTAEMFPLVMEDIAKEFNLYREHALRLKVTLEVLKRPNAAMAFILISNEQIAGMVEVFDAADGEALGMFHIDVINTYGDGLGLDIAARGATREFMAREFARETVRVLAGRKSRTKGDRDPDVAQ